MFKEEKQTFDIVYLNSNVLGLNEDNIIKGARPCIIIKIDEIGDGYVLPLTTKRNGLRQIPIHLSKLSYITLEQNYPIQVNKLDLDYSDKFNEELSFDDIDRIANEFNLYEDEDYY